ncbi:MAG TPA: hypothetical protein PK024_00820 [Methanospirillum sp.]|uniref:hypothetical protein n=1 Tax=Methanospirillum sp. TaxID=45200 RepID=UPI002D140972|nr:hypothetical protein [Methanospirillum sp.]HOJ95372.1 hypothetical protein [Methanospirillum sp.]HOL41570.1 hypothetical protein [Methanospirillum sp.]HPP76853.1 hypothetical protein [Methanospirillum sp.]
MTGDKPCCPADALRRIKMIPVNGIPTGITMLDEIISEVKEMNLTSEQQIKEILLKKVKVYNYISKGAEEMYAKAIVAEYNKS